MFAMLVGAALVLANPVILPRPDGPSIVGTRTFSIRDDSRRLPLDAGISRTIAVQFWYPARTKGAGKVAPYLTSRLLDAMRFDLYLNVDVGLLDGWDKLATSSYEAAPPKAGRFPLVLFSPGFGMARASYTTLAEELASEGIVVAIVDHPYEGLALLPDGTLLNYVRDKAKPPARVRRMAEDLTFLRGRLRSEQFGLPRIDHKRVFACGHSLGGAAALQVGRSDRQFAGAIDLDGAVWGDVEASGTHIPFLVLLNEPGPPVHIPPKMKEERDDSWKSVVSKSPVSATVLKVHPAYHFTFSDAPFLLPATERLANGATLNPAEGRRTICGLLRAFVVGGPVAARRVAREDPHVHPLIERD